MKLRTKYKKLKQRYEFIKNANVPTEVVAVSKPIIKLKAAVTCDEHYYHEPWTDDALKQELAMKITNHILESGSMQTMTRYECPNYICEATLMIVGGGNESNEGLNLQTSGN